MSGESRVDAHYGVGDIMQKIEAGLVAAGKDLDNLSVDDLAPVDEFHTRGREATLEVARLARLNSSDRVLDVGCGLGGTARHLANQYGCKVTGIDLTEEYVAVGQRLTEMVGLSEQVTLRQGSALEIPYEDESFDVVWTEHVQMNIADKTRFYSEIARVLKKDGRFLFHDIFRGPGEPPVFPAPWAENESLSPLATDPEVRAILSDVSLEIVHWFDKRAESIAFFEQVLPRIKADGVPPIGIHLLMRNNGPEKLGNYLRNLKEERLTVVLGMAQRN